MDYPKKSLGQHWLFDITSLLAMVEAATISTEDTVLEIGPGLGTLTYELLQVAGQVMAVEFDRDLAADLVGRVKSMGADTGKLTVQNADILRFDLNSLPAGYKIAANIPYYLTSKLLRVLCESANPFSTAALLVQKEVAERVCARPGAMSLLSVATQYYCHTSLDLRVPARLFTPPPKVDSQILVLQYRSEPLFQNVDTKVFFRLVKAGFATRRKTLENSLSAGLHLSKPQARDLIEAAGLRPGDRAQALSMTNWHALYQAHQTLQMQA